MSCSRTSFVIPPIIPPVTNLSNISTTSRLALTFGIELEFIIRCHPDFMTLECLAAGLDHNVDVQSSGIHTQIVQALEAADMLITLQDIG